MMDETDPIYECDAPKFVDFALLQRGALEDSDADQWFDLQADNDAIFGENFEDSFVPTSASKESTTSLTTVKTEPEEKAAHVLANMAAVKTEPEKPTCSSTNMAAMMECLAEAKRRNESQPASKRPCPLRSPRRAAAKTATRKNHALLKIKKTRPSEASKPRGPMKATRDVKPSASTKTNSQTYEQRQMEEIVRMQRETKRKLRQSRRSFQNLAKTSNPTTVKYSKPPTESVGFHFRTEERDRSNVSAGQSSSGVNRVDFPSTLRATNKGDNWMPNTTRAPASAGTTKVKPFKFELDARLNARKAAGGDGRSDSVVPMAESLERFQKSTPLRFRTRPAGAGPVTMPTSSSCSSLTLPKTPKLVSQTRSRPVEVKSSAQLEEEEIAKQKEYHFKANPINPDIFRCGGLYGVPHKRTEEVTTPHTPALATRERGALRRQQEEEAGREDEVPAFHARPIPKEMFERVKDIPTNPTSACLPHPIPVASGTAVENSGVPQKRPLPLTNPDTPAVALKRRRLHEDSDPSSEEEEPHQIKPLPMPSFEAVFKPALSHKATAVAPFAFEERYKDKPTRKSLVQQILEKEKKSAFHAQPVPDFVSVALPPKQVQPPTQQKPFDLHTDARGERYYSKWAEQLAAEAEEAQQKTEFKATDTRVLYAEPFQPRKSQRPLTETGNLVLHTEVRREQRLKFDVEKHEREAAREQENLQRRALREAEEAHELIVYRKSLVHKAKPAIQPPPFMVKPCSRPLTAPHSPVFSTDSRLRGSMLKTDV